MTIKIIQIIIIILMVSFKTIESSSSSSFLFNNNYNNGKPVILSKKLPEAIIIGAKKCGTRALIKFIGAHVNVSAANAETHYFDRFYHLGLNWYKSQMPYSNQHQIITIEKTPKYLQDKQVPERVFNLNPKMKLIVVLRNPVVRAVSEYVQSQTNKLKLNNKSNLNNNNLNDSIQFQKMLYLNNNKKTINTKWPIIKNGMYYNAIKQWLTYFPIEQFLFVNGEQLIREPSVVLDKVQDFLNLTRLIKSHHFVHNKRKGFACILKPLDSNQIKCLNEQKGRKHPRIDSFVLNDLYNFYRPYNIQLFKLINQKPWWPI
jgi:hypothetical protein